MIKQIRDKHVDSRPPQCKQNTMFMLTVRTNVKHEIRCRIFLIAYVMPMLGICVPNKNYEHKIDTRALNAARIFVSF